jgi:23S rRNA (cytidine1920-2'-O)/16S rRNA (cytidine1409-2'-O)-methyltransferase
MIKERLDILVQRQAEISLSKAQGLIQTGKVLLPDGQPLKKPGERIAEDTVLEILEGPRFVSRGGEKLQAAFDAVNISLEEIICIDAGASTGGFTDCLLQHGAAHVIAVDVGYGQLAWGLRQDNRVTTLERCNVRHITAEQLPCTPTFFTADCSFISLRTILPPLLKVLGENPSGIVLIKPQFEAGKTQVGTGGVVRDEKVHEQVVEEISQMARALGFGKIDVIPSPLLGPAGNREFLAYLHAFTPPITESR